MEINYIKYLKHSITTSYDGGSTYSGLKTIHTVKDTDDYSVLWGAPDSTGSHWLKLNVYQLKNLTLITIPYTGTFESIDVSVSIDNQHYEYITTYEFDEDDDGEIDMTTSLFENFHFIFLKLTVNKPTSFRMKDLYVYGEVDYINDKYISHNYLKFYGTSFRDNYPFLPDCAEVSLKMLEGHESIDDTLFDPSDYSSASISKVNISGDSFGLSANNFPVETDLMYYIWDFDDPQDEYLDADRTIVNPAYSISNPNIIITTDLNDIPEHDYSNSEAGMYIPRLTIKKKKYMLEFTEYFLKS